MRRRISLLALAFALIASTLVTASIPARATSPMPPKDRGLFISPLRQYTTINPGQSQKATFSIANITDRTINVTLSTQQFSVADYTYDYKFIPIRDDWVRFGQTQVELKPYKSQQMTYSIAAPANATPGGHYFTLFATTTLTNGTVNSRVQAASVLYVTVAGDLHYSGTIKGDSMPRLVFGTEIPYRMEIKDTGNTHFYIFVSGQLHGLSARPSNPEVAHILLPGAVRTVNDTIPAPILPGIYTATYGYRAETGQMVQRSKRIIYLPLWFVAILAGLLVVVPLFIRRRSRHRRAIGS